MGRGDGELVREPIHRRQPIEQTLMSATPHPGELLQEQLQKLQKQCYRGQLALDLLSGGACHLLAEQINTQDPSWQMMSLNHNMHAFVVKEIAGQRYALDIEGLHTIPELCQYWEQYNIEDEPLQAVPTTMSQIEDWEMCLDPQAASDAACDIAEPLRQWGDRALTAAPKPTVQPAEASVISPLTRLVQKMLMQS